MVKPSMDNGMALTHTETANQILSDILSSFSRTSPPNGRRVIGIAGAAGLGKSSMTRTLCSLFIEKGFSSSHVQLDGFLHPREIRRKSKTNGYDLEGWDTAKAESNLRLLIETGAEICIPEYQRNGMLGSAVEVTSADFIILDGNYFVLSKIRELVDFTIFFDANKIVSKQLRFERDVVVENRFSASEANSVWAAEERSFLANILPARCTASVVVNVTHNRHYALSITNIYPESDAVSPSTPLQDKTVFLSYSRTDSEVAEATKSTLEKHGARVWIDTASMLAGSRIQESIENAINSSDALVLVVTKNALSSFWVPFEFGYALGTKTPVFPVVHGIDHHDMPGILSSLNCCSYFQLETVLLPTLKSSLPQTTDVKDQQIDQEVRVAVSDFGVWHDSPEMINVLLDALSLDKGRRRMAHIRLHRMPRPSRKVFLDIFEQLIGSKDDHIRGESYYCLAQIPDYDDLYRYKVDFFEKGLYDQSDKVKSCCTNLMRHFTPLPNSIVNRLNEFVAIGLENEQTTSNRSGMVYWAYVALDAHKSVSK